MRPSASIFAGKAQVARLLGTGSHGAFDFQQFQRKRQALAVRTARLTSPDGPGNLARLAHRIQGRTSQPDPRRSAPAGDWACPPNRPASCPAQTAAAGKAGALLGARELTGPSGKLASARLRREQRIKLTLRRAENWAANWLRQRGVRYRQGAGVKVQVGSRD